MNVQSLSTVIGDLRFELLMCNLLAQSMANACAISSDLLGHRTKYTQVYILVLQEEHLQAGKLELDTGTLALLSLIHSQ